MNGEFYFREKLITPEIQELNRQTMLSVVERKPVTVGSGESKVIDEPFLKNMIRAQKTMTESVIKIFN